jgi:autotransporter passenger strand-loop-strand repeat protein
VNSGSEQLGFGEQSGTVVNSGGHQIVQGNAIGAVVNGGGFQEIDVEGTALGAVVNSGGLQDVFGSASATVVYGEQFVSGGTTISTTVNSGGRDDIFLGSAIDIVVNSAGNETVHNYNNTWTTPRGTALSSTGEATNTSATMRPR